MTHKYREGDKVILRNGKACSRFLQADSLGVVFCQYAATPPAYEVNFEGIEGRQFATIAYEDNLEAAQSAPSLIQREAVGVG